jgi:hypothetical protein
VSSFEPPIAVNFQVANAMANEQKSVNFALRLYLKMFNIFVFTSKGSVLIKCEKENTVAWLLETVTARMQLRQLSSPFEKAYREDGSFLGNNELLEGFAEEHPLSFTRNPNKKGSFTASKHRNRQFTTNCFVVF